MTIETMIRTGLLCWATTTLAAQDRPAARPATSPSPRGSAAASAAPASSDPAAKVVIPSRPSPIEEMLGPPSTTEEIWRVLDRDLEFGLVPDARRHLTQLLAQPDLKPDVVLELRERYGSALLIKLLSIPELRSDGRKLVDMANEAARKKSKDLSRLNVFFANLNKSAGERAYAIEQIRMAGPDAIPLFAAELKQRRLDRATLLEALYATHAECWPAVATWLDSNDPDLISVAIQALRAYDVRQSAEFLWYPAAAKELPHAIRDAARVALAELTRLGKNQLPSSTKMLVDAADRYYRAEHQLDRGLKSVSVWQWVNGKPVESTMSVKDAEHHFGVKFAKQALLLDPNNRTAAVLLISLAIENEASRRRAKEWLEEKARGSSESALAAGPDVLADVLDRALREGRTEVAVAATRLIGAIGHRRLLSADGRENAAIGSALVYPNPHVQLAAAFAALELHPTGEFPQSSRVVPILIRALGETTEPQAIVIDGNTDRGNGTVRRLTELGYRAVLARTGREAFRLACETPVDLIISEAIVHQWNLEDTIVNLRADARTKLIPIIVYSSDADPDRLESLTRRFKGIVTFGRFADSKDLAKAIELTLGEGPRATRPTTEVSEERQQVLAWLLRLARGERTSLDAKAAIDALVKRLGSPEVGAGVAEILGYLPGSKIQDHLSAIVVNDSFAPAHRAAALSALLRNIRNFGPLLDNEATGRLEDTYNETQDPATRAQLAALLGSLRPSAASVAKRLQGYQPLPSGARPATAPPSSTQQPASKKPSSKTAQKKSVIDD